MAERNETVEHAPSQGFRFPSALTVLLGVTLAVWLLALVIPTGAYDISEKTGGPVPGTYHHVDADLSLGSRLMQLFLAPVNGLYGVQGTSGFIGPDQTGELFGAAGVFLFVLAIGIFITVAMRTGAIEGGVAQVANRFGSRGVLLIVLLMVLFSIGGTTEGMAEETLGFYGLVVPLVLGLGYDRMVAVAVIHVGAGVGVLASTVNPFATGVASDAAGISIGDGIGFRFLMYVVVVAVTIAYVLRYARRVKADPSRSLAPSALGDDETPDSEMQPLTMRQSYPWQLDWYFPELAALFLLMSIVVGLIGGLGERRLSDAVTRGAGDFVGVGLIIVLARGITVIMNNAQITDTVLHSMEDLVSSTSSGVFGVVVFLVNLPLAFLVPSTSGHATLAMPILAPLGDFAGVSRAMVVTAYQSASGIVNLITPTSAVVMGGLALARVRYDQFLRFVAPLLLIQIVVCAGFIAAGATLS